MSSTTQHRLLRMFKKVSARAWAYLGHIVSIGVRTYAGRPRWMRLVAVMLATALGIWIILIGLLNLGKPRPFPASLISVSPQSLNVNYRRAWFFWPTLIHIRNLRVCGSDHNVQWQLDVDEARVSVDLLALCKRELHATKVRVQGISLRLRQKINISAANDVRLAPLPPIPGIEGPPIIEEGPPEPDIPDKQYNLWSVRIENVDGRAKQAWVDEFRFDGDVHVTGSFYLRPKRWLWVGPASATILSGSVELGKEKLLVGVAGSVGCSVSPFDPRPLFGMEFFRFISGAVRLDAGIPSVRALDYYARIRGSSVQVDGGMGMIHLDGSLHSGVARPLNLSVEVTDVAAQMETWRALGSLQFSAIAPAEGPTAWLARMAPFELQLADEQLAVIRGAEIRLLATTDAIDVSMPAPSANVHAELPAAQVPNLRIINRFLSTSSKLHVDGGTASIGAQFVANTGTGRAMGALVVSAESISAHYQDLHFGGRSNVDTHVATVLLNSGDVDVSSSRIDVTNAFVRDSSAAVSGWWCRVETNDARFRPDYRVPVDVTWSARLQNATPILAFSKRTPAVPGWITRMLTGGQVRASGRLKAGSAFIELSHLKARTGLLSLEGDFRQRGPAQSGVFRASAGPLSVGIEIKNDETNLILLGTAVEPPLVAPLHTAMVH